MFPGLGAGLPGARPTPRLLPELLTSPLVGLDYPTRRGFERDAWRTRRTLEEVVAKAPEAMELNRLSDLVREHQVQADECFWQVYSNSHLLPGTRKGRALADPQDPANAAIDALVAFSHGLERFVDGRRRGGRVDRRGPEPGGQSGLRGAPPWPAPSARRAQGVAISTFHGAKGREWDVVVVAGCLDAPIPKGHRAQGLFDPYLLQMPDAVNLKLAAFSEDRRAFYVAAPGRAERAIFTAAPPNGGRSKPSRFLIELRARRPPVAVPGELPPLTHAELSANLRRLLATRTIGRGRQGAAGRRRRRSPGRTRRAGTAGPAGPPGRTPSWMESFGPPTPGSASSRTAGFSTCCSRFSAWTRRPPTR